MFNGVPTRPAGAWHGARCASIHQLQCTIEAISGDANARDLNRSGLLLETSSPLRVGSFHIAEMELDGLRVNLPLRVAHVCRRYEGGIRQFSIGFVFQLMNAADRLALDSLVARLDIAAAA